MRAITAGLVLAAVLAFGAPASAARPAVDLPAPFATVQPLLTSYRGASPTAAVIVPAAGDTTVQVTDAHGTYTASETALSVDGSTAELVHAANGTHLTTWVVDPTTGKKLVGPIRTTGKRELVSPDGTTNGPYGSCYLDGYPPFTFTYIIRWLDGYAEIGYCNPNTASFNMILSQQLWQADSHANWYKVGPNEITGAAQTGLWDHNVDAACYSGGGPWASEQYASALIEFGGGFAAGNGFSMGTWARCNAV